MYDTHTQFVKPFCSFIHCYSSPTHFTTLSPTHLNTIAYLRIDLITDQTLSLLIFGIPTHIYEITYPFTYLPICKISFPLAVYQIYRVSHIVHKERCTKLDKVTLTPITWLILRSCESNNCHDNVLFKLAKKHFYFFRYFYFGEVIWIIC